MVTTTATVMWRPKICCGQQLLCAYLRPSRIDGAKHAAAILKLLVKRLRLTPSGAHLAAEFLALFTEITYFALNRTDRT